MDTQTEQTSVGVPNERAGLTVDAIADEVQRRILLYRSSVTGGPVGSGYRDRAEALEALLSWIGRAGR